MDVKYSNEHWVKMGARNILKNLNYDLDKNIHEQFMERHKEKINSTPTRKKRGRPKKNLPQ